MNLRWREDLHTSSLTSRAEHCRGTDIILWGFHVTELALVGVGVVGG